MPCAPARSLASPPRQRRWPLMAPQYMRPAATTRSQRTAPPRQAACNWLFLARKASLRLDVSVFHSPVSTKWKFSCLVVGPGVTSDGRALQAKINSLYDVPDRPRRLDEMQKPIEAGWDMLFVLLVTLVANDVVPTYVFCRRPWPTSRRSARNWRHMG